MRRETPPDARTLEQGFNRNLIEPTYAGRVLRLERHRLGARIFVFGLRIHEFTLGFAVLAALLVGGLTGTWDLSKSTLGATAAGSWLVIKDWRDLFPGTRNTAAWSILPHRVPKD